MVGAVLDWRYVRRGGVRPTREDWRYLGIAVALVTVLLIGLIMLDAQAYALEGMIASVGSIIFALWEFGGWRIRSKVPIVLPK